MAQYSGQVTLSSLTATRLPSIQALRVLLAAGPTNSGTAIWVGNDGNDTVSIATGFPLYAPVDAEVTLDGTLDELWAIAEVTGDVLCWLLVDR